MNYINACLADAAEHSALDKNSIVTYRNQLLSFASWFEDNTGRIFAPEEVVPIDIKEYREYLKKKSKPATINKSIAAIRHFFGWAEKKGLISDNPAADIAFLLVPRGLPKWLNRKEEYKFIRTAQSDSPRNYALAMIFLKAGLRVSEASHLLIQDIDISERKGSVYIRYGKNERSRTVPLIKELRQALLAYLKVHNSDSPYLFVSQRSEKMSVRAMEHVINKIGDLAKIKRLNCHQLRHTFAHNLVVGPEPVPLDQVAMLLGHFTKSGQPNIRSTVIYTQPSHEDLEAAVEKTSWY